MPRYKITIEYLGTGLSGFQRQDNAMSVQELVESAISKFSLESPIIYAAGRTDAGVHAFGQVAHFDLEKHHEPYVVTRAINHFLRPNKVSILNTEIVGDDFHARFSAKARHYLYRIKIRTGELAIDLGRVWHVKQALDVEAMREGALCLLGRHDFTSFRATSCQSHSPIKTLSAIEIEQHGDEVHFRLSAPSFLHHMVRNIVGTLVLVGSAKWVPEDIKSALEKRDRSAAGPTAPACGLYFMKVDY